jgi:hypothetical protein
MGDKDHKHDDYPDKQDQGRDQTAGRDDNEQSGMNNERVESSPGEQPGAEGMTPLPPLRGWI